MMKKSSKTLMMASMLALVGCGAPTAHVTGEIANVEDGKIYAAVLDSTLGQIEIIDTLEIKGGKIDHKLSGLKDAECVLLFLDHPDNGGRDARSITLFMGNEKVNIKGDANEPDDFEVTGSEYNSIVERYQSEMPGMAQLDSLYRALRSVGNDQDMRNEIREQMYVIGQEQKAYIDERISENVDNPVGAFLLCNNLNIYDFEHIDEMAAQMEKSMANHKYVKGLRRHIELARPEYEAMQKVQVGKEAPDFELPDINGNTVRLSSLRGKVVLMDFWASWCEPCRKNNQGLVETYEKFAKKGLEVITVSVDNSPEKWKAAVKEDKLKGVLLIDSINIVASTYCVKMIPCAFLIDADGEIVSRDAQVEDLFADIEKMLK